MSISKITAKDVEMLIASNTEEISSGDFVNEPVVSVCMITYNHADFIDQALESVLQQQVDFSFGIVIGDDASTDDTLEIIKRYQSKYPDKIEILQSTKNLGGRINFIRTLQACRGKYIALLEGDDYWNDPLKMQKQVDFLESHPQCALCFTNVRVEYDSNTLESHLSYAENAKSAQDDYIQIIKTPEPITDINDLVKGNYIHTPGVLFKNWIKAEGLPSYMLDVSIGDWPLHMFTALQGNIHYMPDVMAVYRVHDNGLWSMKSRTQRQHMSLMQYPAMLASKVFAGKVEETLRNNFLQYFFGYYDLIKSQKSEVQFIETIQEICRVYPQGLVSCLSNEGVRPHGACIGIERDRAYRRKVEGYLVIKLYRKIKAAWRRLTIS